MRKTDLNLYNFLIVNGVINTPALNDNSIRLWGANWQNVYDHYSSYLLNIQAPNSAGPIEKHPYIDLYLADCNFQRETLLLGTFPPSSYINNLPVQNLPNPNVQNNNPTHYFYGNMNDLWFYLFGLNGGALTIQTIQEALNANDISISDVFAYVQRKTMISAFDSEYKNIVLNCKLKEIFNLESKINTILFTSGSLSSFLTNTTSALTGFRWILEDCCNELNNFTISGDVNGNGLYYPINENGVQNAVNQQNDGIVWWLKSGAKKIRIINLPSPAPMAAQNMINSPFFKKWINYKATENRIPPLVFGANLKQYLNLYPRVFSEPFTKQYRRETYQMVLNNTIHLV
jgi:hypothetical protein